MQGRGRGFTKLDSGIAVHQRGQELITYDPNIPGMLPVNSTSVIQGPETHASILHHQDKAPRDTYFRVNSKGFVVCPLLAQMG